MNGGLFRRLPDAGGVGTVEPFALEKNGLFLPYPRRKLSGDVAQRTACRLSASLRHKRRASGLRSANSCGPLT
jgi:hypothetical protein